MKISLKTILTVIIIFNIYCIESIQAVNSKKVLILSSTGGGGHTAASQAIKSYLDNKYDVKVINPIEDLFNKIDPVNRFSFGLFQMPKFLCAENLYNYLLQNNQLHLINLLSELGKNEVESNKKELTKILTDYIKANNIDLIISVIPYINNVVLHLANTLAIPFMVIPTDLDDHLFSYNIDNTQLKYNKFIYNIPFNHPILTNKDEKFKIPKENIRFIGYPLRSDFFKNKDVNQIKNQLHIEKDKPVIMIMMGAVGSDYILKYCKQLAKLNQPVHLLICIGKNECLRNQINSIPFNSKVSKTIIGFTQNISDLMSISNVIITKSGTHSVVEAINSQVQILLHLTDINWEKFNGRLITQLKLGEIINQEDLNNQVLNLLKLQKNNNQFTLMNLNFESLLNQAISELLN